MTVVTFVGAGSVEFTRDLLADLFGFTDLGPLTIRLHDIDPDRLATAHGIALQVRDRFGSQAEVSAHAERKASFDGADFVVNMIQVGGLASTRVDFDVPARHGVRQTIADTLGIGGIFRALRTFPALDGIAADMLAVCPDAWLLNYTNPMAMNLTYLSRTAPNLRAVGLCHSVYWTVHDLCELIGVPLEQTQWWSAGVNHQAWLLRWEQDGRDLYPLLDDRIDADPELRRRVRVDMYRRLGYYPTETSEHSAEYVGWYLPHDDEVARLRLEIGAYVGISEDNVATYERTRAQLAAGEPIDLDATATEYAPQVIHSMVTGRPRRIVGNVGNTGLVTNLPRDVCVEVPCLVDAHGVVPTWVGDLPPQCAALNRAYLNVVDLTVRAATDGDPLLLREAAMVDPNTSATLSPPAVWDLVDDMVAAHGDLLPPALRSSLQPSRRTPSASTTPGGRP
ncbi:MAG: alpha-glucosidase/alpha-galactosidase [Nocardioidaceae bacterium]